jgi:hypothetical protein
MKVKVAEQRKIVGVLKRKSKKSSIRKRMLAIHAGVNCLAVELRVCGEPDERKRSLKTKRNIREKGVNEHERRTKKNGGEEKASMCTSLLFEGGAVFPHNETLISHD